MRRHPFRRGRVEASLQVNGETFFLRGWDFNELPSNTNLPGPTVRFQLGRWVANRMTLILHVVDRSELDSKYDLIYRPQELS